MSYPDLSGIVSLPQMLLVRDSLHGSKAERIAYEQLNRMARSYDVGLIAYEQLNRMARSYDVGLIAYEQLNRMASGHDKSGRTR